jgi:hypothetical protein
LGGKPVRVFLCHRPVSSIHPSNELMRRCLLRWEDETPRRAFCRIWQRFLRGSFQDRFRRHLTTPYGARGNSLPPKISRLLPGSDDVLQSFLLENGRFTTINVPFPDVVRTEVSGINNRGQIVGTYVKNSPGDLVNPFSFHGFIATPQSEPESKSQLLVSKPNDSSNFKRWTQNVEELDYQFGKWRRRLP